MASRRADAYPWLLAIDGDLVARPPTAKEVTLAEAIARALTELLVDKKLLRAAWRGGAQVSRTISVHTHEGDMKVELGVPVARPPNPAKKRSKAKHPPVRKPNP